MNKAVRTIACILAGLAATCAALLAIGAYLIEFHLAPRDPPLGSLEQQVQQRLQDTLSNGTAEIPLANVADFPWEQACMVRPYTDEDILNKAAGAKLRGYGSIGWIDNESYWTLAFLAGNEITPVRIPVTAIGRYNSGGAFVECAPRTSAVLTYDVQRLKGASPRDFYFRGRPR